MNTTFNPLHTPKPSQRLTLGLALLLPLLMLIGCGPGASAPPTPTPTKTPVSEAQAEATPTSPPAEATAADAAEATAATSDASDAGTSDTGAGDTGRFVTIDAEVLNVRSASNASADILTTVDSGEEFAVVDEQNGWVQIARNGKTLGWVSADFVAESDGSGALANAGSSTGSTGTGNSATTGDVTTDTTNTAGDGTDTAAEPTTAPAPVVQQNCTFLPASMNSPDYGAQAFLWWRQEIASRDLTLMQDAGFNWVKQSFAWETIEIAPEQYNWANADRVVQQVNCHQLKLLARLSTDPDVEASFWAGAPPSNAANFASYAGAVAQRYNCSAGAVGCIQAFQIWNEPNLAREWGGNAPDPAQYVEFLRQAYAAIKAANPNAIVINAGMAPTGGQEGVAMADEQFYEGMYAAMGGNSTGYFDMLGVHGAGFAAEPETDPATAASNPALGGYRFFAFRHVEDIRAIMERNGDSGKSIVLLEFGWTYDPVNPSYKWHGADAGITNVVQGDYLRRAYQYADANWPWVSLMSVLTMPNFDWTLDGNPQDEEQYWWAIMEPTDVDRQEFRPAFIILCDYFNIARGLYCPYDPDPSKRGPRS